MTTNIIRSIFSQRTSIRLLLFAVILFVQCTMFNVFAQITIKGSVYGGGNAGNMTGNTSVTIHSGDIHKVFGGARIANVGGSTFVNIDGEHASDYIIIDKVFGGNDIAGTIGSNETGTKAIATDKLAYETENRIDNTWDAAVRISSKTPTNGVAYTQAECDKYNTANNLHQGDPEYRTTSSLKYPANEKIFIGQLYGGGNGDYSYTSTTTTTGEGEEAVTTTTYIAKEGNTEVASSATELLAPELAKSYMEICGGTIVYAYGGGNNATVTNQTVICTDNPSTVVTTIEDENGKELLTDARMKNEMDLNLAFSYNSSQAFSDAFQVGRFFGGNNKAPMAIIPKWNLKSGKIRNLYSGGNMGPMTSPTGILLEIAANSNIVVDNVYGGCRMADVKPLIAGTNTLVDHVSNPVGYYFPKDFAARLLVRGGTINNVYGGNDISGKVYFGNAVGIYTSIQGDVYGGGNGSYPYTDNPQYKDDEVYHEVYYNPAEVLPTDVYQAIDEKFRSVEALNTYRPNAEQVSIRLAGSSADKPVIIHGSVYVGGNSATLKNEDPANATVELKIGSHVIADKVFLGNNGANMVKSNAESADESEGVLRTFRKAVPNSDKLYNSMNLLDESVFAKYMEGCSMDITPSVVFDNTVKGDPATYIDYSSYIGSFYCGGNVGSMTSAGTTNIDFNNKVIIYDKLVGGCNDAIIKATDYNALFEGGIIGVESERAAGSYENNDHSIKDRLVLNLAGLKIQPKRWVVERDADYQVVYRDASGNVTTADKGSVTYTPDANGNHQLEWNTVNSDDVATAPVMSGDFTSADLDRRFDGGDIYGGCYTSGIVNGNVVINLDGTIVDRGKKDSELAPGEVDYGVFDGVNEDDEGEAILYGHTDYDIYKRRSGVILDEQGMDVLGKALNVFGGGKGKATEIWGSTTINLNAGYTFQVFGGSQEGVIGRPTGISTKADFHYDNTGSSPTYTYSFNGKSFTYDPRYSCYVNLKGEKEGVSKRADSSEDMAECEFMYGGGFEGPICGNTVINLGKGRIFNSFAGSCNADILGHTETYIGRQVKNEYKLEFGKYANNESTYEGGFPWIRDITYGANDLGGRILGQASFKNRVRTTSDPYGLDVLSMVHKYNGSTNPDPDVLTAGAYTEYLQGRADAIFGGCYGTYDFKDTKFSNYTNPANGDPLTDSNGNPKFFKPHVNNAVVNFRPTYYNTNNVVHKVYGAGQGESREKERDLLQNRSYVLIDIPQITEANETNETNEAQNFNKYTGMEVFGAGAWGGVGMKYDYAETIADGFDLDKASAIIDLVRGDIGAAYGASYKEGVTRRTVVNVPRGSTIKIGSIFGGGYGTDTYMPCDAYETHVEYHSANACLVYNENTGNPYKHLQKGALFGGNNNERRTFFGKVNIDVPLKQDNIKYGMTYGSIYGAGCGGNTWSEYTEVNLAPGAEVYEVYGGGLAGKVHNAESVYKFMCIPAANAKPTEGDYKDYSADDWASVWTDAWKIGGGLDAPTGTTYWQNIPTTLASPLVRVAEMDDRDFSNLTDEDKALVKGRYTTNVIINEGATVRNYAYGGGYGADAVVAGTTYIALLGGEVRKDIYAAGTSGSVEDLHGAGLYSSNNPAGFMASTNVYVKGGTVRNVYGGGWRGDVGHHAGAISNVANNATDRDGESHVVIGDPDGTSHTNGIPSITRNVYGGGEGGAIYGTAYVTVNKGYIGYRYNGTLQDNALTELDERYVEELDDTEPGDNELDLGGNVFGGGYVANSYVDTTHVEMFDGIVRGSLYGGGEIGPVGRGTVHVDTLALAKVAPYIMHNHDGSEQPAAIYKGGKTHVYLWGGHVMRDVFGGGRGYDNWNGEGYFQNTEERNSMDRSSKGYVFGSTNVHIRGGEIGTTANTLLGYGNVFGAGNEGFVYSATGKKVGTQASDENLENGLPIDGGGFYYTSGVINNGLSLDCNVDVEPYCKVIGEGGISGFTANDKVKASYAKGEYVPVEALNQLKNRNNVPAMWAKLDTRGITIHNALFAGGNITEGSDKLFANTTTVYGNVAASLRDVYNFDLISLGTEDMGGLYGDGNLTLVDGFRELHIDNYGTDFYSLSPTMLIEDYEKLTDRQKAYYMLKYITDTDHTYEYYECQELGEYGGTNYKKGQKVTAVVYNTFTTEEKKKWQKGTKTFQQDDQIEEGEYVLMDNIEKAAWSLYGVTSIYAGRPMNTIQRADMCGVFGSRMVMKGAQDRVPNEVDYNNYTINRVDEVSLNKRVSQAGDSGEDLEHGNYFGIYSTVKFLGNLTSDVSFNDTRYTDSSNDANKADVTLGDATTSYGTTSYYQWKAAKSQAKNRNNGKSHNKVALASGVYLELKRTEGELTGIDDWGYITGIIELDLINVMPGMGGGYVYARNQHGTMSYHSDWGKVTLLDHNNTARTYRHFAYDQSSLENIETSGNFVHNTKQIIDDCYPNGGIFRDGYVKSPAHYWFIRGSIYVYDQYISAYTGSANAYAEKVEMPLTIAAASNGRMTLREVQPNFYAYYDKNGNKLGDTSANADERLIINNNTYYLNDPVSYWDYRLMTEYEKARFVKETFVTIDSCKIGTDLYPKGYAMLESDMESLRTSATSKVLEEGKPAVKAVMVMKKDENGNVQEDHWEAFDYVFRPSNNLSHNTGYVLTYEVNNPAVWDKYYTKIADPVQTNRISTQDWSNQTGYLQGPTFSPKAGNTSVYAQQEIKLGDIVSATSRTNYVENVWDHLTDSDKSKQATVTEPAYVVTKTHSVKDEEGVEVQQLNPGTPIYQNKYTEAQWTAITNSGAAELAKVCTKLIQFSATDYIYAGQLLTTAEVTALKPKVIAKNGFEDDPDNASNTADKQAQDFLNSYFDDAYYCTAGGLYGGSYFEVGHAYRAIDSWCSMSKEERKKFDFNYDALDLLVDSTFSDRNESNYGNKPQYDGTLNPKIYSVQQPIDYQAEFAGYEEDGNTVTTLTYKDENNTTHTKTASSAEADWLTREQYEDIPNEKHHYSPITVTAPGNYYVVNTVFMRGDIPYTVGQQLDDESAYLSLNEQQRQNIDVFNFTTTHQPNAPTINDKGEEVYDPVVFFYCRENYIVNEKGEGKQVTTTAIQKNSTNVTSQTYNVDAHPNSDGSHTATTVPKGAIISQSVYNSLTNKQQGFIIHGVSPTETSTLYVSSESDIHDLSKEKIITAIYLYEYEESDESGQNVVPVSERHIVNIHIDFKSGVPEIGDISKPDIVLPGTAVGLNIPTVTQGAYRVTESGWELFDNDADAATHTNGKTYYNNETPVYYYQNDHWIAYYAKTYLGKTYSKSVRIKVANYHDMKKVWDDKEHHYYIDHQDVDYEPKIYINDYTTNDPATSKSGLDMFKSLIELSHLNNKVNTDPTTGLITTIKNTEPAEDSPYKGHALLDNTHKDKPMRGGQYLEFFLRADQDHSSLEWTPIANNDGECFSGTLHGDGHTISGLNGSLFNHLCGSVYNLGVTGSFTGGGVADTGEGYVENCWINTTGTPDGSVYAVFGEPTASAGIKQIVNSYCQSSKTYKTTASDHGMAIPMPDQAFYNGEVAYDLNGFYLYKRYCDKQVSTGSEGQKYQYYTVGSDNSLTLQPAKYYTSNPALCSSGYMPSGVLASYVTGKYVEDRFADGDFIYAGGSIPASPNERLYTDPDTKAESYHAIWPDDYIFFGQALSYDHMDGLNGRDQRTHQPLPGVINKSNERVLTTIESNRVYRAPAYYRSSQMGVAHFNPYAVFAATKKDAPTVKAYENMTAIDFTGYNDAYEADGANRTYEKGFHSTAPYDHMERGAFYPPLLDDGGVKNLYITDLTRNLLAYTGTATAAQKQTDATVKAYLHDEAYTETETAPANSLYADTYRYHTVAERDTHTDNIRGHRVQKQDDGTFVAQNDHVLIDHQDFNAPIAYSFADGQRMWYQRKPDLYVDIEWSSDPTPVRTTKGWQGISLPFKAEIVTTNDKGELTHFYDNSGKNDVGHEYWLREFTAGGSEKTEGGKTVYEANVVYPTANSADGDKDYTNTFLWDYYYLHNNRDDLNSDDYQESDDNHDYYKYAHTYDDYPRMAAATPYIIGFPGARYYEFDLSGTFEALTAKTAHPDMLVGQTITFASKPGDTNIGVSDLATGINQGDYTFKPNYLNKTFTVGTTGTYTLSDAGNSYDIIPATGDAVSISAFRPYFVKPGSLSRRMASSIVFSNNGIDDIKPFEKGDPDKPGTIFIGAGRQKVVVSSTLKTETNITIYSATGISVNTFTIQPGETIETRIHHAGVYIVRSEDGRYQKKLAIR